MQLKDTHYSPGMLKEIVWLCGAGTSFEGAEEVMWRIGHTNISDSSIWRRKEEWGEKFQVIEEEQKEKGMIPTRVNQFREQVLGSEKRLGVAMDGASVHIRDEGWKELKVGCSFDIKVLPTWNKETEEWEDLAHAQNNQHVAHLGGPERLGELLWVAVKQRGWEGAKVRQVLGDGARWIWNQADEHFYDGQKTVDWFHGVEHLGKITNQLHSAETPAAKKWYKAKKKQLYQGHAQQIADELRDLVASHPKLEEDLNREAGYFENNKRRMQYFEFREDGLVIGSGMVESGCKQFKARFCGSGMRWNRDGIKRLIPIRAQIMSHSFDTMWQTVYNSPPK